MKGLFSPVDGFQIAGLGKTFPGPTFDGDVALLMSAWFRNEEEQVRAVSLPSNHDDDGTQELRTSEGSADMETREGLEEDHSQTDTLECVEHTEPQPETSRDVWPGNTSPGNV
jgi:hypothetical protein